jgi:hypothetical protein
MFLRPCPAILVVQALVFSSSRNPTLTLTGSSAAALCRAYAVAEPAPSCRVLGFRGWLLNGRAIRGDKAVDALLLSSAAFAGLSPALRSHIAKESGRLSANRTADAHCEAASRAADAADEAASRMAAADVVHGGICDRVPLVGPDDPTRVHFDVAHDAEGCFVTDQGKNNCYDYATDILTNTFAQPGRGSGVCRKTARPCVPNTCDAVRKAAESDGLVWHGNALPDALPAAGHYVSLHIWPQSNFHWLRMDADKFWSHKPGGSPVRNVDNSGRLINDPARADVSPWSNHCGYMLALPSNLTLY